MTLYETLAVSAIGGSIPLILKGGFYVFQNKIDISGQKKLYIHQCQFEKEFNAYVEIWVGLLPLVNYVNNLPANAIPTNGGYLLNPTSPESRKKLTIADVLPAFYSTLTKNQPFLYPDILDKCSAVLEGIALFQDKVLSVKDSEEADIEKEKQSVLKQEIEDVKQSVLQQIEDVKNAIRARVWNLNKRGKKKFI
ncbi:hypothetical protein SMSP2_02234 [Limihaloglobus sulfuriphilus]|uniref:Uncharacterized protein n=1 Tax=Limihaloglobus sulfuriphilus TaxID=1851148 RepID=A0A1Q2MGM5_9BACT|nr:hypothetical protein [Limihaloglobus sulfuriphilus]AQQ71855.1 hypothetical protein SMSP2_02234 [Limihaloglobus sulfuriphilus]